MSSRATARSASTQAVTVSVTDVAPTISSGAASAACRKARRRARPSTRRRRPMSQGGTVTLQPLGRGRRGLHASTRHRRAVTINAIPNFEAKSSYSINVVASDGTLTSTQAVTVSVTDVAPTISSGAAGSVTEGASAGTTVYTAAASDVRRRHGDATACPAPMRPRSRSTLRRGVVTINAIARTTRRSRATAFNVVASDGTLDSHPRR